MLFVGLQKVPFASTKTLLIPLFMIIVAKLGISFLFVTGSEKRMHFYGKSWCFQATKLFVYLVPKHGPRLQLYPLQLMFVARNKDMFDVTRGKGRADSSN